MRDWLYRFAEGVAEDAEIGLRLLSTSSAIFRLASSRAAEASGAFPVLVVDGSEWPQDSVCLPFAEPLLSRKGATKR